MNMGKKSLREKRELERRLGSAQPTSMVSTNPKLDAMLESLARDASKLWNHHNQRYAAATRPLWHIIRDACRTAYVLGHTAADYESGKALDSLETNKTAGLYLGPFPR